MGASSSKKKHLHPTHDRTKAGWTSDEYDRIDKEWADDLEKQLKKFNTDHPNAVQMGLLDGFGRPTHNPGLDVFRTAGQNKIKDDLKGKYKPLLDAAPHDDGKGAALIRARDAGGWVVPESVANVTDMIPGVNFIVRMENAVALAGDPDNDDAVNKEMTAGFVDTELDLLTEGAGPVVKSGFKMVKGGVLGAKVALEGGVKASTKATKLVKGGISGSKIGMGGMFTKAAGKVVAHEVAPLAEHLAANEATNATVKEGVKEGEAAALKQAEEDLEKNLPKPTKSVGKKVGTGLAKVGLAVAPAVAAAAPYVTGLFNKVTESKHEKELDDWRSKSDPLYGPLMTYCRGSMILMFQDKKSCGFIKFVTPALLGAGILAVLPKDVAFSKRVIAALGVSSVYYVVKEDVFHIFVKVPEDEKGNGPAQSVGHVNTAGDTHFAEDSWYSAMEEEFMNEGLRG